MNSCQPQLYNDRYLCVLDSIQAKGQSSGRLTTTNKISQLAGGYSGTQDSGHPTWDSFHCVTPFNQGLWHE